MDYRALFLFVVGSIIFFGIYAPTNADAFRGEMWELLAVSNLEISAIEKFKILSEWLCFGAGRFQPLGYILPYLVAKLVNLSFVYSHLISQIIHLVIALSLAYVHFKWTEKIFQSTFLFLIVLFSFLTSDVITWTFFIYIQFQTLLMIWAIYLSIQYFSDGNKKYLIIACFLSVFSAFFYESGIAILFAQIIYILVNLKLKQIKNKLYELLIPLAFLISYLILFALINNFNYTDSNTKLSLIVFLKPFYYLLYYLRYSIGLTVEPDIYNIATIYKLSIEISIRNIIILLAFTSSFFMYVYLIIINKNKINIQLGKKIFFIIVLTYLFVLVFSFGRVPPDSSFFSYTGLETNFRYFYGFSFLFWLAVFLLFGAFEVKIPKKNVFYFFLLLIIGGNIQNIYKFNKAISLATLPTTIFSNQLRLDLSQFELDELESQNLYIKRMHKAWYIESIPTPRIYKAFTFNANTCHIYPEYSRVNSNQDQFFTKVNQLNGVQIASNLSQVKEINLLAADVYSTSEFPGAGVRNAVGGQTWHVVHIPSPPQIVTATFRFDRKIKLQKISFLPRPDKEDQFFDNALLQGMNDNLPWEDIAEISLSKAPPNGWLSFPIGNDEFYQSYRIKIMGGFALGRFIALSGIKFYGEEK